MNHTLKSTAKYILKYRMFDLLISSKSSINTFIYKNTHISQGKQCNRTMGFLSSFFPFYLSKKKEKVFEK